MSDLRTLAAVVQGISGIVVGEGQLDWLLAALARVDPALTPADLLSHRDPAQLDRLIDEVAVKETFFLRHVEELSCIDWPGMAARASAADRPLRVWSAGCATGEEAYSLALLAIERLGDARPGIDVLGTDLSATALAAAERPVYGTRSMRLVGDERRDRWFVPEGTQLRVGPRVHRHVRFARQNLVHDPFPPHGETWFDLVVCRNVLIYFDAPTVARVTAALQSALAPGGRLLLGTADRLGGATWSPGLDAAGAEAAPLSLAQPGAGRR